MACGSEVADGAERCPVCGAETDGELLHEGSEVRLEIERLGEELTSKDLSLPAGRWGRASEHPPPVAGVRPVTLSLDSEPVHEEAPPAPSQESEQSPGDAGDRSNGHGAEQPPPQAASLAEDTAPSQAEEAAPPPPVIAPHEEISLAALVPPPAPEVRHGTGGHNAVVRPPVLASEALQRDLTPSEPSPRLLRFWSPSLGLLGVSATWLLTHGSGIGAPLCGAFVALVLLGLPRMAYAARAAAVSTVSATGLSLVLWADNGAESGPQAVVLALAVTLLASGLLFRAWHRASMLSRVMVLLGILLGATALWMSETFEQVTLLDTTWQSWAPLLVALPFGMLLMLSLLVFMNARTTAAAGAWASFVLLWYALHSTLEVLHAVWPKDLESPEFSRVDPQTLLAWGSAPIFSALLALGLAQLIAATLAKSAASGSTRPRPAAHFEPSH
ncbi:MAG TPA: hypothetical protein VJR89_02030 [Polyangiales bacterium]|nr:hypothetical protein [Polyangiales bacterium]